MRSTIYPVTVEFGDCDPAGIVFYPNYYRWFDAASHHLFNDAGLSVQELREQYGAVGLPLAETGAAYKRPAYFGDRLEIESSVVECGEKTLRVEHLVRRSGELLVDGFEVRFLGVPHPDDAKRLRAASISDSMREALGWAKAEVDK